MNRPTICKTVATILAVCAANLAAATEFRHAEDTHRWTNVSGAPGYFVEALAAPQRGYYAVDVNERGDSPIEINLSANTLSSNSPHHANTRTLTSQSGTPTGPGGTTVGVDHYISAVQVCLNGNKIKGVRLWGKMLNPSGDPRNEKEVQYSRPNCLGMWSNKVACGPDKVATGVRAHYVYSFQGFSGISLRCAKVEPV